MAILYLPQAAAEQWIVPAATNATADNGLHYATDLKLCNQGSVTTSVTLDLITAPGEMAVASAPQSIAPGQTLVLTNVLQTVWGLTERSGALRITADQQLVIASNVYTDADESGSYGFELDAIPYERWTTAGATVHSAWVSQSADPTAGFTSTLGIVLAAPNSGVDVRVFDASGNQVARQQVTGGVAEQRVALNSLAAGADLPIGRVEFYVTSGRALGYALVTDNVTGDTMISGGMADITQPVDTALNGMIKASTAGPQSARSDLRIFNLSASQAAAVTVTVLSSTTTGLTGRNAFITVAAGQIREIPDVLGQLFQAPEGAVAALRIQSGQPAIVLARTATANTDGSPGTFGALQTPVATADFLRASDAATLAGLRADTGDAGTATTVSLLAGPDGANAILNLFGPDGETLGSATLAIGAWQRQESAVADLFSGIEVPDDSRLNVQMAAGELSAFARAADITSGDTWILPATAQQTYMCPAPAIVSFVASPNSLEAGGTTTLYWSAVNADSVAISPGVANPKLSGSAAVAVNNTTAFTIIGTGACGTVTQTATVAVGPAAIVSIAPSSAMPGQIVTLKLRNVSDPSAIQQVNAAFSKSLTLGVRIETVTPTGDITMRVPFVGDAADPAGHLTGGVTITLALPGAAATGTPFTILPMKYTGTDAIADLKSLTNAAVQLVKSQLNEQQSVPQFAAATPTLLARVDQYAAVLNKLAADISATGTATLPMALPSGSTPPPAVTLTRKQLETFFALYYSMSGATAGGLPPMPTGVLPRFISRDASSGSGPCLADNAAYHSCLNLVGVDPFEVFQKEFLELIQHSSFSSCTFSGANAASALVAVYFEMLFESSLFNCFTQPTEIESFKAQPAPDPIPVGTRAGTLITAHLRAIFDDPNTLASAPYNEALLAVNTLPASCVSQIFGGLSQAFNAIDKQSQQSVNDLILSGALKIANPVDVPVYKCDIADLSPDDPSRLGRREDWDIDSTLLFGLEGFKSGPTSLTLIPYPRHFIRWSGLQSRQTYRTRFLEQDPDQSKILKVPVNVSGGKKLVVNQSLQNIGAFEPNAAISPNQVVTNGADFTVPLITGTYGIGPGSAAYETHSVTEAGENTWWIQISQGGNSQGRVSVDFSNPQNRNNTQHIIIQANAAGVCGMYFTAGARGPDGKIIGPSYSVLHVEPQSFTIDAPGAVGGGVLLEIDGVGGESCVATATIQLLDQ